MPELRLGKWVVDLPYTLHVYEVTEAIFEELVEDETKAELLDGVMVVRAHPSVQQDVVGGFLRSLMQAYALKKALGQVFGPRVPIRLRPLRLLCPAISFSNQVRLHEKCLEGPPDFVLEFVGSLDRDHQLRKSGVYGGWCAGTLVRGPCGTGCNG